MLHISVFFAKSFPPPGESEEWMSLSPPPLRKILKVSVFPESRPSGADDLEVEGSALSLDLYACIVVRLHHCSAPEERG